MEKTLGNNHLKSQTKPSKTKKKPIKIKYISSPMMVRASNASEFRAIVQELTGQNSNVSELSDDQGLEYHDSPTGEILGQKTNWRLNGSTYREEEEEADYCDDHKFLVVDDNHDDRQFYNPNYNGFDSSFQVQFDEGQYWRPDVVSEALNSRFQSSFNSVFV